MDTATTSTLAESSDEVTIEPSGEHDVENIAPAIETFKLISSLALVAGALGVGWIFHKVSSWYTERKAAAEKQAEERSGGGDVREPIVSAEARKAEKTKRFRHLRAKLMAKHSVAARFPGGGGAGPRRQNGVRKVRTRTGIPISGPAVTFDSYSGRRKVDGKRRRRVLHATVRRNNAVVDAATAYGTTASDAVPLGEATGSDSTVGDTGTDPACSSAAISTDPNSSEMKTAVTRPEADLSRRTESGEGSASVKVATVEDAKRHMKVTSQALADSVQLHLETDVITRLITSQPARESPRKNHAWPHPLDVVVNIREAAPTTVVDQASQTDMSRPPIRPYPYMVTANSKPVADGSPREGAAGPRLCSDGDEWISSTSEEGAAGGRSGIGSSRIGPPQVPAATLSCNAPVVEGKLNYDRPVIPGPKVDWQEASDTLTLAEEVARDCERLADTGESAHPPQPLPNEGSVAPTSSSEAHSINIEALLLASGISRDPEVPVSTASCSGSYASLSRSKSLPYRAQAPTAGRGLNGFVHSAQTTVTKESRPRTSSSGPSVRPKTGGGLRNHLVRGDLEIRPVRTRPKLP